MVSMAKIKACSVMMSKWNPAHAMPSTICMTTPNQPPTVTSPPKLRDKVTAIKVARPSGAPIASPIDVAHAPELAPAAKSEPASPAATAAQIFDFRDFAASELRGSAAMGFNGPQ